MSKIQNTKQYDLEDRTYQFAKKCRDFVRKLPKTIANIEDGKQLIKASGSQAANYIEANESLSKKDFEHKLGICKKESKESKHWLRMIAEAVPELKDEARKLWQEANELNLIFTSIVRKSRRKKVRN